MADVHRKDPKQLAAANGVLYALVNAGFGVGVALSGLLPAGLATPYAVSAVTGTVGALCMIFGVRETMPMDERTPLASLVTNQASRAALTSRLLKVLVALHSAPMFMGEVLQVFMVSEWGLDKAKIVQLFGLLALTGVVANTAAAGGAIKLLGGLRSFTNLATLSSLLFWVGLMAGGGHKTALVCAGVGFLAPARGLSASTLLSSEGGKAGLGQGQISGDRANLFAWLKVVGPLLYQHLYVSGKARGFPQLPFAFNAALTVAALVLGNAVLAAIPTSGSQ